MTRILGIDPGSRATGYAVIDWEGQTALAVAHGVIRVSGDLPLPLRLARLHAAVVQIVAEHSPSEMAIEQIFTAHNMRSALVLGQARGALLVAAADSCEIYEYSARAVKKAVAGYGQADKNQVAAMVKLLFRLPKVPPQDAADALAIALCHAHGRNVRRRVEAAVASQ